MAYCVECGTKISVEASYCSSCGVDLSETVPERTFEGTSITLPTVDWANLNWKRIGIVGAALVLIALAVQFIPTLLQEDNLPGATSSKTNRNTDGAPNFSTYKDDFLSETILQRVTSVANVRNYPTSQNTNVVRRLAPGETLSGQWVRGFDPTTKWLRLEDGGYVWEGNLNHSQSQPDMGMVKFPSNLRGEWSTRNDCGDGGADIKVSIKSTEISIHESTGHLRRVSKDKKGNSLYHIELGKHLGSADVTLGFGFSANGRSVRMKHVNNPNMNDWDLYDAVLDCNQLFL